MRQGTDWPFVSGVQQVRTPDGTCLFAWRRHRFTSNHRQYSHGPFVQDGTGTSGLPCPSLPRLPPHRYHHHQPSPPPPPPAPPQQQQQPQQQHQQQPHKPQHPPPAAVANFNFSNEQHHSRTDGAQRRHGAGTGQASPGGGAGQQGALGRRRSFVVRGHQ